MPLLPEIRDRQHYGELFKESDHWTAAIAALVARHGLVGTPERGVLGSHIVYRVGEAWIKMMAPLFSGDMDFEASGLQALAGRLSVPTPRILAEGELEGWRYVVLSHVDGKPIRDLWKTYGPEQKLGLAECIGGICRELSQCPTDAVIRDRFAWNDFIAGQFNDHEAQQTKKSLSKPWLGALSEFLGRFELADFQTARPVFLHADLTFDHFLVADGKISGVIDLADCQVGHFEYELVAPSTFIFKGERDSLRKFLMGYGISENQLNRRYSEKLLAWGILHRYFSMVTWLKTEMAEVPTGDFSALAARVYPLE